MFEAIDKALDDLSLLRAIWSFRATLGRWSIRLGSGARRPIGVIHAGPVYTLHNPDGTPVSDDQFWFNPDYSGDQQLFNGDDIWPKLERDRRWAMRRIKRLPYCTDMENLLIRYIGALDQSNPNVAFLQLWSILERITNTAGAQYDETIRRAIWVYPKRDRTLMKEVLESLRHHRNRYVHSGSAGQESEDMAYRVKAVVDPHLIRLLNNTFDVQSFQEYGDILRYPTEIKALERMRRWSSRALRAAREDEESRSPRT